MVTFIKNMQYKSLKVQSLEKFHQTFTILKDNKQMSLK